MEGRPMGRSRGRARGIPVVVTPPNPALSAFGRPVAVSPPVPTSPLASPTPSGLLTPVPSGSQSMSDTIRAAAIAHVLPPAVELLPSEIAASLGRGALRGRRMINPDILSTRPKHVRDCKKGSSGYPITLQANYFKVLEHADWCLYQYRVDFEPEEDHTMIKKGLVRQCREQLGSYIFDGTVLYTANKFSPENTNLQAVRQHDNQQMRITLKLVGDMSRGDPHYLQFYNILTRKCLEILKLQLVGRNYFDPNAKVEIAEYQFELWPGYITSIRQHENDILMCTDINHKIMRQETILHILEKIRALKPSDYQNAFKLEVIGIMILTGYNNNTYRIDDVDFSQSPEGTFVNRRDPSKPICYIDYYKSKYGITIKVPRQPLLVSRSSARDRRAGKDEIIYLVPELCKATGLTNDMRNDFRLMSALAEHTRVEPRKRIDKLLAFNRRLHNEPTIQQEFQNWNLKLDTKLLQVPGRLLPKENVYFGDNQKVEAGINGDWTRSINDSLYITAELKSWVVVVPERLVREAKNFVAVMMRSAKNFLISEPQYRTISSDRSESYTACLERIMSTVNPQLVMCILMKHRADTYSAIKKKLCIDRPVPSQVVTARCLNNKGITSIATKVVIQMNCKIGGIPWTVHIPVSGLMVVGYDVCRDISKRGTDFGAMVASLDKKLSRYFSTVSAHTSGEELSSHLAANMVKALAKYQEVNKALPSTIVIYRDGVGEGQIPFVVDHEVMNVKRATEKIYRGPVKLGYILVNNGTNTRLFQGTRNPLPGGEARHCDTHVVQRYL
ncbi:piwi-like protein Siwi isoform X2 [Diachasmimorpha longicaudata]|uniref:piwi-like protein Siwi isoform X2 n=1 Tax=Diachasmimorpha longicaudata TaxID=58733 RepID=UPI0030B8F19C